MFSGLMTNAWIAGTVVAVVAGVVGMFVVLRDSAFAAHAIPNGAFAGAAGAALVGVSTLAGLAVFAVLAALGIGSLGRRVRRDVATALALVVMLALGSAFLSRTTDYAAAIFSLLFGEILGVSNGELVPIAVVGGLCVVATVVMYRPLLLTSVIPETGEARGLRPRAVDMAFLVVLAAATAVTVPVVGALLIFSLMIGPPAAARAVSARPGTTVAISTVTAVAVVWIAISASYLTDWPIGFFVGTLSAAFYGLGKAGAAVTGR
jgi:zinc/manganese transport system permease protein